ncbi:MAG: hypothetical protein HYT70_01105 [Candidatus Aenigmarchaeota archaeon]|nr:hypothetical protein [Candidatus Aenigmarchaeota archaeon]
MELRATLGKLGLLGSFAIAIIGEVLGADAMKFASLLIGGTSLVILLNYAEGKSRAIGDDVSRYLKFLKWPK